MFSLNHSRRYALIFALGFSAFSVAVAPAEAAPNCAQLKQNVSAAAGVISRDADAYWATRKTFITMKSSEAANATEKRVRPQLADQTKARAFALRGSMPQSWARLSALLTQAQAQNCMSQAEILAVREPAFKSMRHVNVDHAIENLAAEENLEAPKPPQLPKR